MFESLSNNDGLKGGVVPKISVNINGFISTEGKRGPEYFFLAFGADTEGDNLIDGFFSFEIGCLLHGDLAEGVDVHSGVGQVNRVVFDFDFLRGVIDNSFDSDKDFHDL
jgi:hypothetical protein